MTDKPCPFCRSAAVGIAWGFDSLTKEDYCAIRCICGARGPKATTEKQAWGLWNNQQEDGK